MRSTSPGYVITIRVDGAVSSQPGAQLTQIILAMGAFITALYVVESIKVTLKTKDDLSRAYTPGVARISQAIAKDPSDLRRLTIKRNTVAVVTDGSAVLGLGNIGAGVALPVMEGKAP